MTKKRERERKDAKVKRVKEAQIVREGWRRKQKGKEENGKKDGKEKEERQAERQTDKTVKKGKN